MLKLTYSTTSPYARKVRVCALELGVHDRIELETVTVLPTEINDDYYRRSNPLGKIPALRFPDGTTMYDSSVICEYLDSLNPQHALVPQGAERWAVLTQHQLASGITDALILMRYESWLRPEQLRWQDWYDGQQHKVDSGLRWFEEHPETLHQPINLAQIALGCTLDYMDFRFEQLNWRPHYPNIVAWYESFSQRPSMVETLPR